MRSRQTKEEIQSFNFVFSLVVACCGFGKEPEGALSLDRRGDFMCTRPVGGRRWHRGPTRSFILAAASDLIGRVLICALLEEAAGLLQANSWLAGAAVGSFVIRRGSWAKVEADWGMFAGCRFDRDDAPPRAAAISDTECVSITDVLLPRPVDKPAEMTQARGLLVVHTKTCI